VLLRPTLLELVRRKKLVDNILIVGTGELAGKLCRAIPAARRNGVPNAAPGESLIQFPETPAMAAAVVACHELAELTVRERISRVIVAEPDAQRRNELAGALLGPRLRGLQVCDAVDFYERLSGKIWLDGLHPEWLVYTDGFNRSRLTVCVKRCFDLIAATILVAITAPLVALIAFAIRLGSKGPVFFRQVRVGQHGKPFVLYKFRSMREDAEASTGPVWADANDGRATGVGRVLRKFRLDEIPQAFNVLRGDMSFVGPRPERPFFVNLLRRNIPFYELRHSVKPGITGWAQTEYPYGASVEDACEKLQYDLYYAKHMSLACDAKILLKTAEIVFFGRGR
jgi:sugar transferase (PEP-CTERM system associated)